MRKNKAIAIIAAICAVSIAGGVVGYTVGQRSEYMTIGAPHATPSEMPEGITVGAVGAITVPGYERMSFKAGQKEQPVILYNPAGNDWHLLFQSCSLRGKRSIAPTSSCRVSRLTRSRSRILSIQQSMKRLCSAIHATHSKMCRRN